MATKVALITGGNSGIGLALAGRLLDDDPNLVVCLGCRNPERAAAARSHLLKVKPGSRIEVVRVDVSNMASVYSAAQEIKQRYDHLDYLYMNAGILPVSKVDWNQFAKTIFSKDVVDMFRTGKGLLRQENGTTADGLKEIFATNVFGHFVLIKELGDHLGGTKGTTQIVWTSSENASSECFDINDIQDKNGSQPYSSSKYLIDLVSVALNEKHNSKGVYSHSTCPGLVMTNLTRSILPDWFWTAVFPFLCFLRLFLSSMTISPENGSEALVWVSRQNPESLSAMCHYNSSVTITGRSYVKTQTLSLNREEAIKAYEQLDKLETELRPQFVDLGH